MPLINCKTEFNLSWSKECVSQISITPRIPSNRITNAPVQAVSTIQTTGAVFQINNAKLYVKQGLKRTISRKKV